MTAPRPIGLRRLRSSNFFWIVRRGGWRSLLDTGAVTTRVPRSLHDSVLSSEFEDWCLDELDDALLASWRGLDLYLHFLNGTDAVKFDQRWIR